MACGSGSVVSVYQGRRARSLYRYVAGKTHTLLASYRRCLAIRLVSRSLGSAVSSTAEKADVTSGFTPT
jgi:hypothetical protein